MASGTQGLPFVQITVGRLTADLSTARSNLRPHTFIWGYVEKSYSQNVLKAYG